MWSTPRGFFQALTAVPSLSLIIGWELLKSLWCAGVIPGTASKMARACLVISEMFAPLAAEQPHPSVTVC